MEICGLTIAHRLAPSCRAICCCFGCLVDHDRGKPAAHWLTGHLERLEPAEVLDSAVDDARNWVEDVKTKACRVSIDPDV